eukprot:SAG11_NODE_2600_length_3182_cov_3.935777_2_plen_513_part_00
MNSPYFNNSDLWWAHTITSSYAAVALNMNANNASLTVEQAKIFKEINPKFKFLVTNAQPLLLRSCPALVLGASEYVRPADVAAVALRTSVAALTVTVHLATAMPPQVYQNAELGPLTHEATRTIAAHPGWWARTDDGVPIKTNQGYELNHTVPEVRKWCNGYPVQVFGTAVKELLDGLFYDGMGYNPGRYAGVSRARHDAWFEGKMKLADEARALYGGMNGGEVWGNGAVGVTAGYNNYTYKGKPVGWHTSLDHLDTGFLEGAGGYWYENRTTGEWIPDFFEAFLQGVIAASTGGKTVVLHFSPGPAFPPIVHVRRPQCAAHRRALPRMRSCLSNAVPRAVPEKPEPGLQSLPRAGLAWELARHHRLGELLHRGRCPQGRRRLPRADVSALPDRRQRARVPPVRLVLRGAGREHSVPRWRAVWDAFLVVPRIFKAPRRPERPSHQKWPRLDARVCPRVRPRRRARTHRIDYHLALKGAAQNWEAPPHTLARIFDALVALCAPRSTIHRSTTL